jgi:hypothetical protein
LLCAVGALSVGCARPTTARVSGTVYQANGKPLPGGSVVFYPTEGKTRHATAEIGQDGKYDMPEAPVGPVKIAVNNIHLKEGIPPPVGLGGGMPAPGGGGKGPPMARPPGGAKKPPKDAGTPPKGISDKDRAPPPKTTAPQLDRYVPIDKKNADPETSELTFEVKPGTNTHDIKLR